MLIVAHRRNTLEELRQTPPEFGVEMDVRSRGDGLIVTHDPFTDGAAFEDWIAEYRHALLILNVKEEGLEERLLAITAAHGVQALFFLDQSFPFLVRTALSGERRCAVRVSEYESVETALALAGKVDWVWVDSFTRYPLSAEEGRALKAAGFRLCLVSPELQGRDAEAEAPALRARLARDGVAFDAVCTKRPDLWA